METILEKTTKRDQKIARAVNPQVAAVSTQIAKAGNNEVLIQIEGYKGKLEVPKSAMIIFLKILNRMAEGDSFALFLSDDNADLSTQQGADLLGVSRPHIVSLLEQGEIPFHKVGTHRRIHLKDLIAYNKKIKKNRADKLDFLADQAQELNLGY
ncbi:helix-turn-helix domain-containing protein [Chitinophaga agrisoli]|uniref:Helix-turn-helix domain-containing protein n=1 Tax=Chitinophaga agrisoli TaxID=2607653 RepID=A0A5B2VPF1_9BACT|nr:helix-turn-helix domain-containing protein [Chitinophaga agrisoli]KAA2239969.1 helix-turn-helix domain-containing protein [Chitinophaga agrisoli]